MGRKSTIRREKRLGRHCVSWIGTRLRSVMKITCGRRARAGNVHGLVDRRRLHPRDRRSSGADHVAARRPGGRLRRHRPSPIYAFRESLRAADGASGDTAVFGVLSLVVWAIVLIVAVKYVVFVMRADNEGEGGTMALLSLALPVAGPIRAGLLVVGLAGASLFFGDAIITPAISVLSAVEGLGVASPGVTPTSCRSRLWSWSAFSRSRAAEAGSSGSCSDRSWRSGSRRWPSQGSLTS